MSSIVQITRGCEYAVTALRWIAAQPDGQPVSSDRIAGGARLPQQFASNILTRLVKSGLLRAHRGAQRGYTLARSPAETNLLDVIEAYDGPFEKPWCFLDREKPCSEGAPCPLHRAWRVLNETARAELGRVTLADLPWGAS